MKNKWIYWVIAIIITLIAAHYQRITGPTYPKTTKVAIDSKVYKFELIRTETTNKACLVKLKIPVTNITGKLYYHHFSANEPYDTINMFRNGNELIAQLPTQPPAGKLQYYIELTNGTNIIPLCKDNPVVIRFKGEVPASILIPHIFFIFFAMFFSNLTGLFAISKHPRLSKYISITLLLFIIGGLIFGPIVQHYAFGKYWTGIPFDWDLTDNKALIGFIFWFIAFLFRKNENKRVYLTIIAAIMLLIIFSIPHSVFGSHLNYSTGQVQSGR